MSTTIRVADARLRRPRKPRVLKSLYTTAELAKLVNRSRKTIISDVRNELLSGVTVEIVRPGSRQVGWAFTRAEVQRYVDYRWSLYGNRSPLYNRGDKPRAVDLVRSGYTLEGAAQELGIKVASVRRMIERERCKENERKKDPQPSENSSQFA